MPDVTPEVEPKDLADLLERYPGQNNVTVRLALRIGYWRGVQSTTAHQIEESKRQLKRMMEVKS